MCIECEVEHAIDCMLKQGTIVLVAGAWQVGKTTMLKHHCFVAGCTRLLLKRFRLLLQKTNSPPETRR